MVSQSSPPVVPQVSTPVYGATLSSKPKKSSTAIKMVLLLVGFVGIVVIIYITYIASVAYTTTKLDKAYVVNGQGMSPTIVSGQKILLANYNVLNTKLLKTSVSINDIVLFNVSSGGQSKQLLQRVVALGGDRVVISNGKLTVYNSAHPNGFDPSTAYEPEGSTTPGNINIVVPAGDAYMLGDNRSDSLDSQDFGPVPISSIIGKEIGIIS